MVTIFSWLSARWWMLVIAGCLCAAGWNHAARIAHVSHVSNLAGGDQIEIDSDSQTGYESGFRKLVVPERNVDSFQWIMQVQEMHESGNWRLKHVDYDNAPEGRSVRTASLYRWWLGGVAWIDHTIFGTPIGISVERAAVVADPVAQLLLLLATAIFIACYFNGWSAALFSVGFIAIFPLGSAFAPGQPDDSSLLIVCAIWSVLPLAAGISRTMNASDDVVKNSIRRLFFVGGFIGGLGMWIGVAGALPVLIGIVVAGASAGYFYSRKRSNEDEIKSEPLPWRAWAIGGVVATLAAWLIDRSPAFFESTSWRSDFVHPLFAAAWLGCGEILARLDFKGESSTLRKTVALSFAGIAICGLAYTLIFHGALEVWSIDPIAPRLTRLPIDPAATSIGDWMERVGEMGMLIATLIPAALLIVGVVALVRFRRSEREAKMIAIALGPTVFAMSLAVTDLGWWSQTDGLALTLATVAVSLGGASQALKWSGRSIVLFASIMGVSFVYSGLDEQSRKSVSRAELETLIERHLAQWLALRAESSSDVALAPPNVSVSLAYFGGLQVLGTPYPENSEGFSAAVRLCAAPAPDEARALAAGRELSLIIHPSWDTFLEDYARLGNDQPENSFVALLNRWLPPRWLEPVPFQLPAVPEFEDEWVVIYRTVEVQDNASAIGRLVEYFLATRRGELALMAQSALESHFPDALVTHITAAEIAASRGDAGAFNRSVGSIVRLVDSGADFYLTWQFRVSMSLVLMRAKRLDEAKAQLELCLSDADQNEIRRLSTNSLNGLLHLAKAFKMEFPDPALKSYALSLLPAEQRAGL